MPILQLGLESKTLSEQDIFDIGLNFIRTQLATVQGAAVPLPYGGKFRQIMVDLESRPALCQGYLGDGCLERRQRAEHHSAGRRRQDRQDRLSGEGEQQPAHAR